MNGFKFLIYGKTGWIGGLLGDLCTKQGIPFHVFNAAGVTGRPNADWCESHKAETIISNVAGALILADVCREYGVLKMNFTSGCVFDYDDAHPQASGIGFGEDDAPNYTASFYSKTKAVAEELLKEYDNVCLLRIRMPMSSDLNNPRNFAKKLARFGKVVNIPNSMTVLDELVPISIEMAKRNLRGIWNLTNPGVLSHNQILELYKEYVYPDLEWQNFSVEEQAKVIGPRCHNEMDASKLKKEFPHLLPARDSLIKYVFQPNRKTPAAAASEI